MFATIALAGLLAVNAAPIHGGEKDIVDTAVSAGSFTTLATALTEAGLVDALKGEGPFTVFAPTDAAFAALPEGTIEMLLEHENRALLQSILTYHVVAGEVTSEQVVELSGAKTLSGQRIDISVVDGAVMIDGATVTTVDIKASNGIIHVIDAVIMPETRNLVEVASDAGSFGTLLAAATAAGLVDTLTGEGPFTILAPTDAAFAALPEGTVASLLRPENKDKLVSILTYHVLPGRVFAEDALAMREFKTVESSSVLFAVDGDRVSVAGATVLATDIEASNGVIHVIDAVILPPERMAKSADAINAMIDDAINLGAPLFNNGQPEACAAVYTVAAKGLAMLSEPSLPAAAKNKLNGALTRVERIHDASEQAWILREALDQVRAMPLANMMPMAFTSPDTPAKSNRSCSSNSAAW